MTFSRNGTVGLQGNPERDELVMALVECALAQPASMREAQLRAACAGDLALFQETWNQVQWEERMQGLLPESLLSEPEPKEPFAPGEVVADRFLIVRAVGRGGMAVVYEALDQKLEQRIAIKCPKRGFRHRLPPEVRSALHVTHPNVCRTYEIHTALTRDGEVDFLTMEFLEGETLSARIERDGPLKEVEARDIALQMCAGLEEAHRKGVIHRDLKANNVILTRSDDGQCQVVITDFGLARDASHGREPWVMSGLVAGKTSSLWGTPEYMAPELWKGSDASIASDIYALGVVLYEIVTGGRPFTRDAPPDTRASEPPPAPSRVVPAVAPQWDRAIAGCLAPDPKQRFRRVAEVRQMLEGRTPLVRTSAAATIAVALTISGALGFHGGQSPLAPLAEPVRLAILDFATEPTIEPQMRGTIQDVTARLLSLQSRWNGLVVIPENEALRYHVQTPRQARSVLGATHAFEGRFQIRGNKVLAAAFVTETRTDLRLRDFSQEYDIADVGGLGKALTATVTAALHLPSVTVAESVGAPAYPFYAQGLYYLRRDRDSADAAIPQFEKAIELDSHSALPHAGLAEAQLQKFDLTHDRVWMERARQSVMEAERRNPDSAQVHLVDGVLDRTVGMYEQAVEHFRRAIQLEPKNPDARNQLARTYEAMNQSSLAVATYQEAITAQPTYYKPYMDLARFYYLRAMYEEAATQYRTVIGLVPGLEYGHANLGKAYGDQGRYGEAEHEFKTALALRESQDVRHNLAVLLAYEGRDVEAVAQYERALAIGPETYLLLMNVGDSYRRSGRSADAIRVYSRGLKIAGSELVQNPRDGYVRAFVGYLSMRVGDRARAESEIEQALRLSPDDAKVRRRVVLTYAALGQREDVFRVLASGAPAVAGELSRHPDLMALRQDPRFVDILKAVHPR